MDGLTFELARLEHARNIDDMRRESSVDLFHRIGLGSSRSVSRIQTIRERIKSGDPETLRRSTLYVASVDGCAYGSVVVSTFPPGFWKKQYWQEPGAVGLGVFGLAVFPQFQRKGVGRFLMQGVEELAVTHGIKYVRLDAYTINPISTTFYRAIGYEGRGEIDLRGTRLTLFEKPLHS